MLLSPLHLAEEKRAALMSLVIGSVLLGIKFAAYANTRSAAILSDALESIVNVVAAGFALYAVSLAARPADAEHPYGHGKIEFLSAGFEGGMILIASLMMAARVAKDFAGQSDVRPETLGLSLMASAMLINAVLGYYLIRLGKRRGSITLEADGKHLFSDVITSAGVLVALIAVRLTGWKWLDPLAALLVTIYIAFVAVGLLRRSIAGLMDQQDVGDEKQLVALLDSHTGPNAVEPMICSYHKLRHRHSGRYHWVDFHIMVPAWWNIARGHEVASRIEYEIELTLGEGNATAHIEPCWETGCASCAAADRER